MPHIHEKIDFTAEVLVINKGRVLLRKHDKYGIWLSVGGHIELDEDPAQAAVREVKEEVGLDVELVDNRLFKNDGPDRKNLITPIGINRHRINPTHEHVTFIYVATSKSDAVVPEKSGDVWKWCTLSDIDGMDTIPPEIAFYARKALQDVK